MLKGYRERFFLARLSLLRLPEALGDLEEAKGIGVKEYGLTVKELEKIIRDYRLEFWKALQK